MSAPQGLPSPSPCYDDASLVPPLVHGEHPSPIQPLFLRYPQTIGVAGRDFIFGLLLSSDRRRRTVASLVIALLGTPPLFLAWRAHALINPSLKLDAMHDWGYLNQGLLLLPFITLFIPYYLGHVEEPLVAVRQRGVVALDDAQYATFVADANRIFGHPLITLLPGAITVAIFVFGARYYWLAHLNTWNSPATGSALIGTVLSGIPSGLLLYYLLPGLVVRIAALYFVIRRFLRDGVTIHPFHPDGCGGLSPLSDFSLRLSAAGIALGISCLIGLASVHYQYHFAWLSGQALLLVVSYIVGLAVAFFVPLLAARQAMKAAKNRILLVISDRFNYEISRAVLSLDQPGGLNTAPGIAQIDYLAKLYKIANDMPVYPFNRDNVAKFFSSVLWPLIVMMFETLKGRLGF